MLVIIILCLALVGLLHLTRGTAVRHVQGVAADGIPLAVSDRQCAKVDFTIRVGVELTFGRAGRDALLSGDGF